MTDTRIARFDSQTGEWHLSSYGACQVVKDVLNSVKSLLRYSLIHSIQARKLRRYISGCSGTVCLSLGSGRSVPSQGEWIGIDFKKGPGIFGCDLRRGIPIEPGTIDGVLAEHILEHFPLDDLPALLSSCLRVLKPGAPIRIVCPDADLVASIIENKDTPRVSQQLRLDASLHSWPFDDGLRDKVINRIVYQFGQHRSLLTAKSVQRELLKAGFRDCVVLTPDSTQYFERVPTTHFERFPDSKQECFVIEAVR
ncbi:class I SAM-dependent methyltransferase [Luteococcus sp. OSA5]|uniref:class I SAM-dependent methyltransferase n=1 Tax=Luteococcus sp. OSA5 TaxID=3401630 RepID=UPI003B42D009